MQLALPFTEALALATATGPLPPLVRSVRADGSVVHAEIDLRQIPDASRALRLAAAAAGTMAVTARLAGYDDGVARLTVTAHARGLPAHKLLGHLIGPVNAALRRQGLPEGLVTVVGGAEEPGEPGEPMVVVRVQDVVDARATGVLVTAVDLREAVVHVTATVGDVVRLR
ncbi:hypothetical protein [Cellulomonas sp. KRMCY2]|uniref:hypothetical protein n=1 Tax=Cellulomonas sp. KRMCY2 TaxID=1304865 RepID=UPI00045E6E5F|nr:hypothetical protein [Cellulomonas sp. KRMCY2]